MGETGLLEVRVGVLMVQNVATMSYSYLVLLCETRNNSSAPTGAPPILFRL